MDLFYCHCQHIPNHVFCLKPILWTIMANHYILEKRHQETQHSTPVLSSICYTSSVCRKNASTCPAWASEIHSSGRSGYYCVTRHESNRRKSEEQSRQPSTDREGGSTGCDPGQVEGRNGTKGDHRRSIAKYEISSQPATAADMNQGSLAPPHHHRQSGLHQVSSSSSLFILFISIRWWAHA